MPNARIPSGHHRRRERRRNGTVEQSRVGRRVHQRRVRGNVNGARAARRGARGIRRHHRGRNRLEARHTNVSGNYRNINYIVRAVSNFMRRRGDRYGRWWRPNVRVRTDGRV